MHDLIEEICRHDVVPSEVVNRRLDEVRTLIPELWALRGRPQPPQYHPEGDCWIHVLQVMDRARELSSVQSNPFLHFVWGGLCHDLGKGITPDNELPHHYNHEALGVQLVCAVGIRLEMPAEMIEFGTLCAREHLNIHKFFELRPVKKVDLIKRLGRWVYEVATVSQADAQGRGPDYWNKPYPQAAAIIEAHRIMGEVYTSLDFAMQFSGTLSSKTPDQWQQIARMEYAKAIAGKFGK